MKITFISPYPDITSFGIRTLSAYLKQAGHQTQLIFLPDPHGHDIVHGVHRYGDRALNEIIPLCDDSDIIGITLMTNFFENAVQITQKIKSKINKLVIWGGVHPTVRPEESLQYADMVCIGEGEDPLLELVNKISRGDDYSDIMNLWIKTTDKVVKNPLRPLPHDLAAYPFPDYSMEDHHVMVDGHIKALTHEMTESLFKKGTVSKYLGKTGYQTMTSRGCPYSCAYCINDAIKKMYGRKGTLRWRSPSHVMEELTWVQKKMPYVDYIWISDDEFMARNLDILGEFCQEYKEKIGLPFSCLVSPFTVTEEKMALLVDAGLIYVQMGVESGSARMQELFRRKNMHNKKMMRAINIINKFQDKMYPPSYDFLIDAPYETDEDKVDSLRFISEIPKPYRLQPFTLILYPGTHMYDMAKQSNLIVDERKEIYSKTYIMHEPNYLNLLMILSKGGKFPSPVLKFLISSPIVNVLNSKALKPVFKFLYMGMKNIYNLAKSLRIKS